ncbi:MAG TPA: DUF4349 domain-containing protein [Asticcacaulis sp.]|nr:DUF4349 domain-containing protein [Asticcacaulis sp.]
MKIINFFGLVAAVACLTACQKPAASYEDAAPAAYAPRGGQPEAEASDAKGATEAALRVPQLAYDYSYGFSAGAANLEALVKADQSACERAGVLECQMISMTSNNDRDAAYVNKTLELRVTPHWLKTWQGQLEANVAKAHGRIVSQSVSSEDLSLQIVNTTAHIQNQQALRDRLIQIIKGSHGKIADLVEAETQLAKVQEDIDASQSALAVMQKRVATTHLTLTYQSEAVAASQGTFAPVVDACKNILRNMMGMVGILITLLSYLAVPAVILVPLAMWLLKRRKARKATETPPPAP